MKNLRQLLLASLMITFAFTMTANGQTPVSGGIYSNTTWTLANSPYIVTDTVVVFPGVTLTIEPGVTVKFADHQMLEVRQSKLIAMGTSTDSITFTSNSISPTQGIWENILLNNSNGSKFNYCNFYYAQEGIHISHYNSNNDSLIVRNSSFNYNYFGIHVWYIAANTLNEFDSCNFFNNHFGLQIEYGYGPLRINYCNISYNYEGYYSVSGAGYLNNCTVLFNQNTGIDAARSISNSTISNNQTGIFGLSLCDVKTCIVNNNITGIHQADSVDGCIINNNQSGVSAHYILNSIIDSNIVHGIEFMGNVTNCQIKNNGIGIYLTDNGYTVKENTIENNTVGVEFGGYNNIFCNKICNNLSYDFQYAMPNSFSIANNYWCTTDSAIIASHIYDGYDNVSLGIINFMPTDTSLCYLNGCALIVTANVINATCDTCHNGSATVNVSNGFAPYTYTWYTSPLQTTQTATGLAPGTYTVCVADGNGCTACNYSVFIDSTNCTGFSVTAYSTNATCSTCTDCTAWVNINGGTPPYTYTWYTIPMQNTPIVSNLGQGTYAVCVTDFYGCVACDSVHVGIGNCSAYFYLYADTAIQHHYFAVNMASGVPPLTYLWNWGDGNTSTGPYPSHTYATAGNYTICLTITDSAGCTDTHCNSFYLQKDGLSTVQVDVIPPTAVGITDNMVNQSFSIFPNPASNLLTVQLPENLTKGEIEIYNLMGQAVFYTEQKNQRTLIDISGYDSGIYVVEVTTDKNIFRQKLIKQ